MTNNHISETIEVKKPSQEQPLTNWEAKEWIKCAQDIEYFLKNYIFVQNPQEGAVLLNPRDYQKRIIKSIDENDFVVGCMSRQSGKTTLVAAYLLHQACFFPDMAIGLASNNLGNAKDIMARIRYSYEKMPFFLKPAVSEYNKHRITFATNNSYIESAAITESTFRGRSLNRVFIDELAFTRGGDMVAREFWKSLLPTISGASSNGSLNTKVIIMSTPNGTSDLYSELVFGAENNENGFKYVSMDWDEVPGRDETFKEQMLQKMTEDEFAQEYLMHFISTSGTLVDSRYLEKMRGITPVRKFRNMDCYVDSFKNRSVAMSADVSEGVGKDYHAIQIFDIDTFEQLAEYKNNKLSQSIFTTEILDIFKELKKEGCKNIYFSVEHNGLGIGVTNLLENSEDDIMRHVHIIKDKNRKGVYMNHANKKKGCAWLKDMIETQRLTLRSKNLISELKFFIKRNQSFEAERGKHDDLVMACVINMLMMEHLTHMEDKVFETMNTLGGESDDEHNAPMGIIV